MNDLHLAAVGFVRPVIDILEDSGMPVNKLLRETGLDSYDLNNSYGYIPVRNMHVFLERVSSELAGDSMPALFRDKIKLSNAGLVGETAAFTPDLLAALNYATKYDHLLLSNERVGMEINGAVTTVRQWYTDTPIPGRAETELLSFCLLLDGISIAAGSDWFPSAIQVQGPEITGFDSLVSTAKDTHVQFNQPCTSVSFPTSLLTGSMLKDVASKDRALESFLPGSCLSDQLQCLMDSRTVQFDLVAASEVLGVSSRTLKRYLKAEGTSFSEVVDQWRFKKSLSLLADSNNTINEISQMLHYSNTPNFIRAFTRWTGVTPMRYRESLV